MASGTRGVILGQSDTGKTYLALAMALHIGSGRKPYGAVIDPFGYYVEALTGAGWHHQIITEDDVAKRVRWTDYMAHYRRVVFEPVMIAPDSLRELVGHVATALTTLRNGILIIDEGKTGLPRGRAPMPAKLLYTQGRHGGVDIITVAQRAQDVDIDALTQANFWAIFSLTYRDRDFVADQLGIDARWIGDLRRYEFLFVEPQRGRVTKYPASWLPSRGIEGLRF